MQAPGPAEAVIVAGGLGTRLLPLTATRPKHLLEVGGVPFLEHQISRLAEVGIEHVVLATSYRAELFEPVLGDGSRWGIRLTYVWEEEPLGTGGALRNVVDLLESGPDDAVVVLNGDILSDHDLLGQLEDFHHDRDGHRVEVSLHLVEVEDARAFGCVPTDDDGRVRGFVEKSKHPESSQVNAGCYVFRRRVLSDIPPGRVVSVERETFPALVTAGALVVGFLGPGYWRDVGTPAALVAASRDLVLGVVTSPATEASPWGALMHHQTFVHPDAVVNAGSALSRGVRVDAGAVVSGCVLMADAHVGAGVHLRECVLGRGSEVAAGVQLTGVTLGDDAQVRVPMPEGDRVDAGEVRAADR